MTGKGAGLSPKSASPMAWWHCARSGLIMPRSIWPVRTTRWRGVPRRGSSARGAVRTFGIIDAVGRGAGEQPYLVEGQTNLAYGLHPGWRRQGFATRAVVLVWHLPLERGTRPRGSDPCAAGQSLLGRRRATCRVPLRPPPREVAGVIVAPSPWGQLTLTQRGKRSDTKVRAIGTGSTGTGCGIARLQRHPVRPPDGPGELRCAPPAARYGAGSLT